MLKVYLIFLAAVSVAALSITTYTYWEGMPVDLLTDNYFCRPVAAGWLERALFMSAGIVGAALSTLVAALTARFIARRTVAY